MTTILIIIVVSVLATATTILAIKLVKQTKPELKLEPPTVMPDNPNKSLLKMAKQRPIDKVINFINMDMEGKGYEDATQNNNEAFEEEKMTELRERGKQICDLVIIEYNEKIAEIEVKIKECEKTGLLDTKERLDAQKKIFEEQYIKEIEKIKNEIESNDKFKEKTVISSYRRGFAKWRKAIAEGLIEDQKEVHNELNNKN